MFVFESKDTERNVLPLLARRTVSVWINKDKAGNLDNQNICLWGSNPSHVAIHLMVNVTGIWTPDLCHTRPNVYPLTTQKFPVAKQAEDWATWYRDAHTMLPFCGGSLLQDIFRLQVVCLNLISLDQPNTGTTIGALLSLVFMKKRR